MGRMQREKGKRFERDIAAQLRERWPNIVVRRASQAERADNPDVFSEGHPVLDQLWMELQDARAPSPIEKLEQAESDIVEHCARRPGAARLPVVVWHRLGERTVSATTRLWVLGALARWAPTNSERLMQPVTMSAFAFFDLVERCKEHGGL